MSSFTCSCKFSLYIVFFIFEIIGALLIASVYVPEYGFKLGLFKSLFQSISAFCNAGFDLLGQFVQRGGFLFGRHTSSLG